jgi:hypothetical protein
MPSCSGFPPFVSLSPSIHFPRSLSKFVHRLFAWLFTCIEKVYIRSFPTSFQRWSDYRVWSFSFSKGFTFRLCFSVEVPCKASFISSTLQAIRESINHSSHLRYHLRSTCTRVWFSIALTFDKWIRPSDKRNPLSPLEWRRCNLSKIIGKWWMNLDLQNNIELLHYWHRVKR